MIRAFVLSLLIATSAFAKGPVCRVIIDHQGNLPHHDLGTGTLIQDRYVVTAAHLFFDGDELVWVRFEDAGKEYKALATVVGRDDVVDVALLKLDRSVPIKPVPVGDVPKVGDRVKLCGYGQSPPFPGHWRCSGGKVVNVLPQPEGYTIYEASPTARDGDSGGPIFDAEGRIALVLSAAMPKSEQAIGVDFRPLLEKHLPKANSIKLSTRYPQRGRVDRFYRRGRG